MFLSKIIFSATLTTLFLNFNVVYGQSSLISQSSDAESTSKLCQKPRAWAWCSITTQDGRFSYWYAGFAPVDKYNFPEGACNAAMRGSKIQSYEIVQKRLGCYNLFAKNKTYTVSCEGYSDSITSDRDVRVVNSMVQGKRNCLVTVD